MKATQGTRFEALQQRLPAVAGTAAPPSGLEILAKKIVAIATGHHQWPDPGQSRVTISHAIYMEPVLGSPSEFQPF